MKGGVYLEIFKEKQEKSYSSSWINYTISN